MRVSKGWKIKRLNPKRDTIDTIVFLCDCCEKPAAISIVLNNLIDGNKKDKKITTKEIRLCREHLESLRNNLNLM